MTVQELEMDKPPVYDDTYDMLIILNLTGVSTPEEEEEFITFHKTPIDVKVSTRAKCNVMSHTTFKKIVKY